MFYDPKIVLSAAGMTLAVTLGLTIYAWTTKTDITMYGGSLFILSFGLLSFGFIAIFTHNRFLYDVYCLFGVAFYGFYLVYDT